MSFWQQDAEKVVVTLPGPPDGAVGDVEVVLTQNSLRVSLRSAGTTLCDAALHAAVKPSTGRYGIKTWRGADGLATHSVVLSVEKAARGDEWPALFAETTPADAQLPQVITRVRTAYDYEASDPNELSFAPGAVITVLFQDPSGWWQGFLDGQQGNFPSNFVEELDPAAAGAGTAAFDVDDPAAAVSTARGGRSRTQRRWVVRVNLFPTQDGRLPSPRDGARNIVPRAFVPEFLHASFASALFFLFQNEEFSFGRFIFKQHSGFFNCCGWWFTPPPTSPSSTTSVAVSPSKRFPSISAVTSTAFIFASSSSFNAA